MPEQNISINFSNGVNTKSDPWQLPPGQFLSLQNMVFQTGNQLTKRSGYANIIGTAPSSVTYLTSLNDNLIAIGTSINAYSTSTATWITKGTVQPCSVDVKPLVRNNLNQLQVDSITANGLVLIVYTQSIGVTAGQTNSYLYAFLDEETGQNIVSPTVIPTIINGVVSGSSRVFLVGRYFVIVTPVTVLGTSYLQYCAFPINHPTLTPVAQNVYPEAFVPIRGNPGWDGCVTNGSLVVAYNTTAGGQGIHVTSLLEAQIAAGQTSGVVLAFTNAAYLATMMSVCVDNVISASTVSSVIYISFWNSANNNTYICAVYTSFGVIATQFNPVVMQTAVTTANIASCAQNGVCTLYSEVVNAYSYDSSTPSNYIIAKPISSAGVAGTGSTIVRSVGLASKAFIVDHVQYFLAAYQSSYQNTFFLINATSSLSSSPVIVAKLAYQNGGGYLTLGLPQVTIVGTEAIMAYLFKQNVQSISTANNTQQSTTGNIYSQLGINQVSFELETFNISSSEIARDLHISGGFLSMFDGYYPVEHNFFLFPDAVAVAYTASTSVTPTGTWGLGAFTIVVSSAAGILPGMTVVDTTTGANLAPGTQVVYVSGTTVTISKAALVTTNTHNLLIQANVAAQPSGAVNTNAYFYSVTYEWTDMQGNAFKSQPSIPVGLTTTGSGTSGSVTINVPNLRLTQKVSNPVKIVIYRWSLGSQAYNQVTSIFAPVVNDTTTDSVSFVDTLSDANAIGNNLLYTTGGVVPNTNGPACDIVTLFDTRLWLVDAEDKNLLWVSKSVVEGAPVDMSPLFTIYVSPNVGTTASTGPITAIFPMDDKLIIFKKNSIFYINGIGPDNLGSTSTGCSLGNYSQPTFISSVVGCENQQSLVLTPDGIMFQSEKGIWLLTRALGTNYIGAPVEVYNEYIVTSANNIAGTNFVLFTLNTPSILMYDYYYQQWGTWTGPSEIVSSCISNGLHTVLNAYGIILQETPGQYLDGSTPVVMSFATSWFNLASIQGYERFYEFYLLANYLSPHLLNVQIAYDYNPSPTQQSTIRPTNFSPTTPSPFGVPTPFGSSGSVEQWRVHAKRQLCQSFQLLVQEVFDPTQGMLPGAGFTMSGITCKVAVKKSRRPIRGANSVG